MSSTELRGLDLSELFYQEAVRPILQTHCANLRYSAALIGPGSEVLGFDDAQSTDHDWGPRLQLFLSAQDQAAHSATIDQHLRAELPVNFRGYPLNMAQQGDQPAPNDHSVVVTTVAEFMHRVLPFDPFGEIQAADWVRTPQQNLLSLTRGRVYHDGLDQLAPLRARLAYYPHDVWLYLLAAQWKLIAQEEAFMGRCGQTGDELGSRLVAARLVRDLMRLAFLQERRYAPYLKWFGSAFAQLDCAAALQPLLLAVLSADGWQTRQAPLTQAYTFVAERHNALGITAPLSTAVSLYYNRPFLVISADRFVDAIRAAITDADVLALPDHLGGLDQYLDSTDALNCLHSGQLQLSFGERKRP